MDSQPEVEIPEDRTRLFAVELRSDELREDLILNALQDDRVVLIKHVTFAWAEKAVHGIADRLRLVDSLKLQAAFAASQGHRHRVGEYFMSVTERGEYQFTTPHSEGSSFVPIQLASFFCHENTTDGGDTILFNTDDASSEWQQLREVCARGKVSRALAPSECARARGLYRLTMPADVLKYDDHILGERPTVIPGLTVVDVLATPRRARSRILDRDHHCYWGSVGLVDHDAVPEFARILRQDGLLKCCEEMDISRMDVYAEGRIRHSGVRFGSLFRRKITHKLVSGDLLILNNVTWAHSVSNWSPTSGSRNLSASFA